MNSSVAEQATTQLSSRRGFTMAELFASVVVSGILPVGLGSALTMVTRSLRPDASTAVTLDAAPCVRMLQEDLGYSSHIFSRSSTSVKMLTTDADRDGRRDVVEYSWSGTSGAALNRTVNGGSPVAVCRDVAALRGLPQPATRRASI